MPKEPTRIGLEHREVGPALMKRLASVALLTVSKFGWATRAKKRGRIKKKGNCLATPVWVKPIGGIGSGCSDPE